MRMGNTLLRLMDVGLFCVLVTLFVANTQLSPVSNIGAVVILFWVSKRLSDRSLERAQKGE